MKPERKTWLFVSGEFTDDAKWLCGRRDEWESGLLNLIRPVVEELLEFKHPRTSIVLQLTPMVFTEKQVANLRDVD